MVAGFAGAPASKACIQVVTAASLLSSLLGWRQLADLQLVPHISRYHQAWRIFTHYFASTDSAELLLCLIIMYGCFPEQERRLGSRKFVSFILRAWVIHALALFFTLSVWSLLAARPGVASSGSYPIVFIVLTDYLRMSPGLWTIQVGSARVDENALPVLLAFTLAISRRGNIASSLIALVIAPLCWPRARLTGSKMIYLVSRLPLPSVWKTGDARKPIRSSRAERRKDPVILSTPSLPQLSPNFSFNLPNFRTRGGRPPATSPDEQRASHANADGQGPAPPSGGGSENILSFLPTMSPRGAPQEWWESQLNSLQEAFPTHSRDAVVQALQLSDGSYAGAVERLLTTT